MPGKIYPNEMKKLLQMLSSNELKMIQKDFPFKHMRDEKIHELMQKGVSPTVLAELPGGLSKSTIHRIGQLGVNRDLSDDEQNLKNKMVRIKAAVGVFTVEIKKILKHRRK